MRSLLLVCAIVSAGLSSGPADALVRDRESRNQQQDRRDPQWDQRRDRSADAGRRAQERNGGGRVLSVEPDGAGYRVKVLKDGEVRVHHVEGN